MSLDDRSNFKKIMTELEDLKNVSSDGFKRPDILEGNREFFYEIYDKLRVSKAISKDIFEEVPDNPIANNLNILSVFNMVNYFPLFDDYMDFNDEVLDDDSNEGQSAKY